MYANQSRFLFYFSDDNGSTLEAYSFSEIAENPEISSVEEQSEFDVILFNLKKHFIRNKLTYQCLESTAKLLNSMPGTTVRLPTTKYLLLKNMMSSNPFKHQYYIYCKNCKKYLKCSPDESTWMCACGEELKLCAKHYYVYIKLEEQLKNILEKQWDKIIAYNNVIQSDESENIRDYYSGTVIRNLWQKNELFLMINSDGISIKKSGYDSVWPIQIICNFLPLDIRYLNENILCVAFFCQKFKPEMLEFFEPFALEIEKLQCDGFVFKKQVFRTAITCAVFDLPAKASFQHLVQFNGYYACGYCFNEGELINKCVRYTWRDEYVIRTNESIVLAMDNICETMWNSKMG